MFRFVQGRIYFLGNCYI